MSTQSHAVRTGANLEFIAFKLNEQSFCIETMSIREIRGWATCTPIPHSPPEVLGLMNLRGAVIPIIDLAAKLGMKSGEATERRAIIVAEVNGQPIGLMVDQVTDMLTVGADQLQPTAGILTMFDDSYCEAIVTHASGMICFLSLTQMFDTPVETGLAA